jgi:hypothetical protein
MTLPKGFPVLTDLEWWGLKVGEDVLRPLILVMVTLEGQKYVTVSLVIPMVEHIHKGLHEVHECLQELGTVIGTQILPDGQEFHMENILESMIHGYNDKDNVVFNFVQSAQVYS